MKRLELIKYLEDLRNEEAGRHSRHGFTAWAVLGAIVALLLMALPLFQKLEPSSSTYGQLCLAYAHFHTTLAIAALIFEQELVERTRPSGHRLWSGFTTDNIRINSIRSLLFLAFPAAASLVGLYTVDLLPLQRLTLKANVWLLGLFGCFVTGTAVWHLVNPIRKQHQSPRLRRASHRARERVAIAVLVGTGVTLCCANLFYFWRGLLVRQWMPSDISTIAISFSLISVAITLYVSLRATTYIEVMLGDLQRDFILYGVSRDHVVARLEEELLGQHLGNELRDWLRDVRGQATAVANEARKVTEVASEMQDPKFTIWTRFNKALAYKKALERQFEQYAKEMEGLIRYLKDEHPLSDLGAQRLIEETASAVNRVSASTTEEVATAVRTIQPLLEGLNKEVKETRFAASP